jgi:chorismate-pyruvate lyase
VSRDLSRSPLAPLDEFYAALAVEPPRLVLVEAHELPPAERTLLPEPGALTARLEKRERQPVALRVLERTRAGDVYRRRVVLQRAADATPLALGAIRVDLARVSPEVKDAILAEREPFGRIVALDGDGVRVTARLFRIEADTAIAAALRLAAGVLLHGRSRIVTARDGATIAEIAEILAPTGASAAIGS